MVKRGRYILKLEDRSKLRTVLALRVGFWWLAAGVVVAVLLIGGIGWLMGWYQAGGSVDRLPADSREEVVDMLMRLDSLKSVVAVNDQYINNVSRLLDTGRMPTDSSAASRPVAPLPPDSLPDAGDAERAFVESMNSRGDFRSSALASMAAEGVRFGPLTTSGIQTQGSMASTDAVIVLPDGEPVLAPADARVVDMYYTSRDGYTLLLQHPRGFISRISGLGKVIVTAGTDLSTGDAIGFGPGKSRRQGSVTLRLWHNGTPLRPADYIRQPNQKMNSTK